MIETIHATNLEALSFEADGDLCLSFWALAVRDGWIDFPIGAHVLEIGCAEADWQTPMLALRPDLLITGIDWRACDRPAQTIQGDVLTQTFARASFDAIVSISAIEHIGLGVYDDDPLDADGDRKVMQQAHDWLVSGGWMYLDVPYRPSGYVVAKGFRGYDDRALLDRLCPGFRVRRWARCEADHPDAPYMALLLDKV